MKTEDRKPVQIAVARTEKMERLFVLTAEGKLYVRNKSRRGKIWREVSGPWDGQTPLDVNLDKVHVEEAEKQ